MTPYEKLKSLPQAEKFLKPGIRLESLERRARRMSDTASGTKMRQAKAVLLRAVKLGVADGAAGLRADARPESCGNDRADGNCGKPAAGFPRVPTALWESRQRRAGFPHSHSSDDRLERGREANTESEPLRRSGLRPPAASGARPAQSGESHRKEDPSSGCFRLMSIGKKLHFQAHPWIGICCGGSRRRRSKSAPPPSHRPPPLDVSSMGMPSHIPPVLALLAVLPSLAAPPPRPPHALLP